MRYISRYPSVLGEILLSADEHGLNGLWFEGERGAPAFCGSGTESAPICIAKQWLDIYFSGREPDFSVPLSCSGTAFQLAVWEILRTIPYGQTTTYGEIAKQIAARQGRPKMSAQAVGGAARRNPVSIIVPCHRVIGADGNLTGYAAGIAKKRTLLELEQLGICKPAE